LLTLDQGAATLPAERMPSSARRIVQLIVTASGITPDLGTSGGSSLLRLTGGCLEHGEESIPFFGFNSEGLVQDSTGRPVSGTVMDVDIPIKGNELLNIGYEQNGTILGGTFDAEVCVVVEY